MRAHFNRIQAPLIIERLLYSSSFVRASQVLETADSYEEAVHQLDSAPLISPVYYIVGGLSDDQGVVVSRDRLSTRDLWPLDTKDKDQW